MNAQQRPVRDCLETSFAQRGADGIVQRRRAATKPDGVTAAILMPMDRDGGDRPADKIKRTGLVEPVGRDVEINVRPELNCLKGIEREVGPCNRLSDLCRFRLDRPAVRGKDHNSGAMILA